jgi:uncharacterized RDD family membrane protein YckC
MEPNKQKSYLDSGLFFLLCLALAIATLSVPFSLAAQETTESVAAPAAKPAVQSEADKNYLPAPAAKRAIRALSAKSATMAESNTQAPPSELIERENWHRGGGVRIGSDQRINADEKAWELVTIGGNAELAGEAETDMVTILGNAKMTGIVGHDMVTLFGDATVDGPVNHDLVVIFGNLNLGPKAVVKGNCVVIFGKFDHDLHSVLGRQVVELMPWFSSLGNYLRTGPLMGRLLPPQSGLAWIIVAFHFILYLFIAVILPKPTAAAIRRLDDNLLLSLGVGVLIMILLAPVIFMLIATGIGIILVPFVILADVVFAALGKSSILEFIGLQILRRFRSDANDYPILAFLIGFLIITAIYMIPILGLLVWIILRPLALGAAVLAVFGNTKRNGNGLSAPGIPVYSAPRQSVSPIPPPTASTDDAGGTSQGSIPLTATSVASETGMAVMPRAGFWIRTAATILDFVFLVWLSYFTHKFFLLFWIAYHITMWTWKGTTIGGIICSLKVVRVDGRPVDLGVSFVRSLSAVFSAVALCLGFFWVGWTRTRQSWHDLIADTVIVRVPRAVSLI